MSAESDAAIRLRRAGGQRPGTVTIRDFDLGLVRTMGGVVKEIKGFPDYYLDIPNVEPPVGFPGVAITFGFPEDYYQVQRRPCVVLTRDDIEPAMQRWHPGSTQYYVPSVGARSFTASDGRKGFTGYEDLQQAVPFDFMYTITALTTSKGNMGSANAMVDYLLRRFPPYSAVYVPDSVGDNRTYSLYMDGLSMMDEIMEVSERTAGYAMMIRIEGELDLCDPVNYPAALSYSLKTRVL